MPSKSEPAITTCDCPVMSGTGRTTKLPNHTLACLRLRRGDRTLTEYYGPPAKPRRPVDSHW